MSDIVDRLRRAAYVMFKDGWQSDSVAGEAADHIDALKRERDELKAALEPFVHESLFSDPHHEFVTVKRSDCDIARLACSGRVE